MLGNNHSVMPGPAFVPLTGGVVVVGVGGVVVGIGADGGVVVGGGVVGIGADGVLSFTCDDVMAADVAAGVGTGSVDVDARWQDGVIEGFVEPEEDACPEDEE